MLFYYALIELLSVILYLQSYFPIQPKTAQKVLNTFEQNEITGKIDKFVLIIIDSLRYDFVTSDLMPKSVKMLEENGCLIKLKAETPTVTLPRIKAMTTGNVPQFIDVLNNLGKPDSVEDSLLHRARAKNKSIIFYGDDTWLQIFPEMFTRSEGTVQFFINDFYEVDTNVTKNLNRELQRSDWDILILHYLGLDHIGHVHGPKSSLIKPKLIEMDNVVENVFKTVKSANKLIFVTSDHGMRDGGGHGGSTFPEIFVPLLVLGMDCKSAEFAQIDLAANLAVLLGLEIPQTNIGQLQKTLLSSKFNFSEYLNALKFNSFLLNSKLNICEDILENATLFHKFFITDPNENRNYGERAAELYRNCSREISEKLQISPSNQNITSLFVSIAISLFILVKMYKEIDEKNNNYKIYAENAVLGVILLLQLFFESVNKIFSAFFLIIIILLIIRNLFQIDINDVLKNNNSFLLIITLLQPFLFFTTSFLLEEHLFWYFFATTFFLNKFLTTKNKLITILLTSAFRFVTVINQVGDKWSDNSDLSDFLLIQENIIYLKLFFLLGLFLSLVSNYLLTKKSKIFNAVFDLIIFCLIYSFRMVLNENVFLGRTLWLLILIKLIVSLILKNSLISIWILIISLLLKPYNVILIGFCVFASCYLKKKVNNYQNIILSHWWLGNVLFFAQGHDNSLSCVDISSGYIGLESYQPFLVSLQVLCHTFALPALSHWLLLINSKRKDAKTAFSLFLLLRTNVIFIVSFVLFIHRDHPFIWSVFASKIFVEGSHFMFLFTEICLNIIYNNFFNKN